MAKNSNIGALSLAIQSVEESEMSFCRYITANDTGATGGHQAGFYVGKEAAPLLFNKKGQPGTNMDRLVEIEWQFCMISKSTPYWEGKYLNNSIY